MASGVSLIARREFVERGRSRVFMGVLVGTIVAGDGRSNWYKGAQLILFYVMIALLFYFLPDAKP